MAVSSSPRDRILGKLDTGELPRRRPRQTYAGYGTGELCAACDGVMTSRHVEYEMHFGGGLKYRMHWDCVGVWQADCERQLSILTANLNSHADRSQIAVNAGRVQRRFRADALAADRPVE